MSDKIGCESASLVYTRVYDANAVTISAPTIDPQATATPFASLVVCFSSFDRDIPTCSLVNALIMFATSSLDTTDFTPLFNIEAVVVDTFPNSFTPLIKSDFVMIVCVKGYSLKW